MNIKPNGLVAPCWRSLESMGNLTEENIKDIWNSPQAEELRKQFLNGEKPVGCKSCWDVEAAGGKSTRAVCNAQFDKDEILSKGIEKPRAIELRFSNLCNFRCLHCNPKYSSQWEKFYEVNPEKLGQFYPYSKKGESNLEIITEETVDTIINEFVDNLEWVQIAGGEPLIQKNHYRFLSMIPAEEAKHIVLDYSTNLSALRFDKYDVLPLWEKFKEVRIKISVDGDRDIYSYVRTNGDVTTLEDNIKKLTSIENSNFDILVTCTTSLLNITRYRSIVEYLRSFKACFHTSLVQYPEYLNIRNLPKELKQKVADDIKNILNEYPNKNVQKHSQQILNYMNSKDQDRDEWNNFVDFIEYFDRINNTNFLSVYPEFEKYWRKI